MSSGEVKKVSRQDIQLVQNLIERCLQLYMNQKEVVSTLLHQAKIEPGFTELVWQKLEEENQEFFRAYYLRLIVKDQIQRFNDLLERQVASMRMCATGSIPMSNGSQIWSVPQNSTSQSTDCAGPNVNLESMHQTINGNLPHVYTNGASSVQPTNGASSVRPTNGASSVQPTNGASSVRPTNGVSSVQLTNGAASVQPYVQAAMDVSAHSRRIDVSPNMLMSQSSNLGMMQGLNGGMINSAGYSGNSRFLYGSESNVLEARPGIGDSSVSPFSNVELNSRALNENTFDAGPSSFGFLGQIPRNFSLSDLTADFTNSSDILESYSGSAFLATDTNNFSDPQGRGEHQDINRMDTISEGLSYEDFASD